jgi:hypothetical protein
MSGRGSSPGSDGDDAERGRRRAQVFGEVLPETTADERDEAAGRDPGAGDEWLRDNVPPHHGD